LRELSETRNARDGNATELGIREARVEKISTPREMERLMSGNPPGLVINGQLVWSGGSTLPTKTQVAEWIREVAKSTVQELS